MLETDLRNDIAFVVALSSEGDEEARAPFQAPRRHQVDERDVMALRMRLAAALAIESSARIDVTEWVAHDPRQVAHTTRIVVIEPTRHFRFSVAKAVSNIELQDIRDALGACVVRRGVPSIRPLEAP